MRLRRLILGRYGHLTDAEIAFPDTPDLHIVVGANEAGKSTALSAIGDALFRFPHRTPYDFLHSTRDLRIGVELQAADDRRAVFYRRKGRKDDLTDAADDPVPESAIAAFLGGATRERFDTVFGLNGAALRDGGRTILEGGGDAGSAIMGAYTGVHDYRRLADRLEIEAGRLFGDKRGRRAFHEAAERYHQARHALQERRIDPEAWKSAMAERDRLEQAQRENAERLSALHAERSRLHRARRTIPLRRRLTDLAAEIGSLGAIPDLPADVADRFAKAISGRDQAERDLLRERPVAEELGSRLAGLPDADPVLAEAAAIDALMADRQRIAAAMADRDGQRLRAAQLAAAMAEEGGQLGLTLDADALAAKRPGALDREHAAQALRSHERLGERHSNATARLSEAAAVLADARARCEAHPAIDPPTPLRETIERIKLEGRLDAQLADAAKALRDAQADEHRALAALVRWTGTADALQVLKVPLDSEIARSAETIAAGREAVRAIDLRLEVLDRELTELDAAATADAAAGELPTQAAIDAARTRRDQAWAAIRRVHIEGGKLEADDPAVDFETLIRAADLLADRRMQEQQRVATAELRQTQRLERQILRDKAAADRACAAEQLGRVEAAWRGLWHPSGIEPDDPAVMREWLHKRGAILALHEAVRTAERRHAALAERRDAAMVELQPVAPGTSLADRLKAAEAACRSLEAQVLKRDAALKELAAAEAEHRKQTLAVAKVTDELAAWRAGWEKVAALLGLPADAPPGLGTAALRQWEAIDKAAAERREALNRVAEMTEAVDRFNAVVEAVRARVAFELGGEMLEVARRLAERLAAARRTEDERALLARQRSDLAEVIAGIERQRDAASGVLDALRTQAGVADDEALRQAIERSDRSRTLAQSVAREEATLHSQDDGRSLGELEAEAQDIDFDAIPARIEAIERELAAIAEAEKANLEQALRVKDSLAEMEKGRDAAASAQAMETALADIDDVVVRYPPLRMAQVLLRAGIERFRRQQQGPLLAAASLKFARLTEGRYDRLEVDEEEDGKPFVIARRPDGTECRANRLSEGTLDQLYLALRLAAIETEARTTEPLPFIGDDLLVNFDDNRAKAALRVLAEFSRVTQVILLTHHDHIAGMA
ncbi:MAG TPA: AAA family ATPase [Rhodopila sp.]|nr:AAA family ATPase [Rhodopila sp.]